MRFTSKVSVLRAATLIASAGAAIVAGVQGCSAPSGGSGPSPTATAPLGGVTSTGPAVGATTGTVGMMLTLPGGETLNTVSWTVTGPNGASTVVQTGSVNVQSSLSVSFDIANLPAGTGYTIALSGTSVDGSVTCSGSVSFSVAARMTTAVTDLLQCNPTASEAGMLAVTATPYDCAIWSGISALPSETTVGHSVAVSATATGADPSALTYAWSAPTGFFDSPSSASANFTCTAVGAATLTVVIGDGPVPDGGACNSSLDTTTVQVTCDPAPTTQALVTTVGAGVFPIEVTMNQGTGIGAGAGSTPFTLTNLAADPNNTQTIASNDGGAPFLATGNVPDTAAGFCNYPTDGGAPSRISHPTTSPFVKSNTDPRQPMAPFYFPLVYASKNTTSDNAVTPANKAPIIGLFDWRPKDIDESVVAAESDDNGLTWWFMQSVLELNPDYTNTATSGFLDASTSTGCPTTVTGTNGNFTGVTGSQADDGWGHATVIQLPGLPASTGQFLYLLDRNTNDIPGQSLSIVDNAPLHVINLAGASNKFPIWNTNNTNAGANDIRAISSALQNSPGAGDAGNSIVVQSTVGLLNPDGIMAVFPPETTADAGVGSAITVLYVQKILNGDDTGSTALPAAERCNNAPFSGKNNDDISNVRLATTTDGVNFTDLGIVSGLNDTTTVDYTKTRWISPRGTLLDINGNGSLWGLYFSGGNCLDGDSDAFHYIGYAESADKVHWTVYNGINNPIASINPITVANQAGGAMVTVPAVAPLVPTQSWFAERLYAPTAVQIDSTHLSLTFAGYGVQTPSNDFLDYRAIGNVVLTVSQPLPANVPNNINAH
jgi:hypothetical protein